MAISSENSYNGMETTLQRINTNYISLPEAEVQRNNAILNRILQSVVENMKKNSLFKGLFREVYYGGSYYTGLKVGRPDEYDIDLLLTLPECAMVKIMNSEIPGFVRVQVTQDVELARKNSLDANKYALMSEQLMENNFLVTAKVSAWMHSAIDKAVSELGHSGHPEVILVSLRKDGPAYTLNLSGRNQGRPVKLSIDLVPCFVFPQSNWPKPPFRQNPVPDKPEFLIVPKQPHRSGHTSKHWRLSFQDQENALISDHDNLKPALRLLKKLRDTENQQIASYYIKTMFLWELETNKDIWKKSLSYVFMTMLKKYKSCIDQRNFMYYWNKANNLVDNLHPDTLRNISNRLAVIISEIERNPVAVAKYLLSHHELMQLQLSL